MSNKIITDNYFRDFTWCIYKAGSDTELDLTTPAPDGIYGVVYTYLDPRIGNGEYTKAYADGIVVRDGEFDFKSAVIAIERASINDYTFHGFIEKLEWTGKYFEVHLGS